MRLPFRLAFIITISTLAVFMTACGGGGDDPAAPEPPKPAILKVIVSSADDGSLLEDSNVVLYRADTREAVNRDMTDENGVVIFVEPSGDYFLNVSAHGFQMSPPAGITAVPFFAASGDSTLQLVPLELHESAGSTGYVIGSIVPPLDNFLVTAEAQSNGDAYFTSSGPDGFFVLFNLPYGDYDVDALKAGYLMSSPVTASLDAVASVDSVLVDVGDYAGSDLDGQVTFLASENSIVDITLLDPRTRAVVPGLTVDNASNLTYAMNRIPDGDYLAWASLKNDGYVIDPDWLFKNPSGLDISFASATSEQLDFSVTGAITLLSPTNPADNTRPAEVLSLTPTFSWEAYPSTKEYFIEVRDLNGNLMWGGFDASGAANHGFIGAAATSVDYNFDSHPSAVALEEGKIYQWRLWADKGSAGETPSQVDQLISASEDLRGLFMIPLPGIP